MKFWEEVLLGLIPELTTLLEASNFIETVEKHSGYKVACLEEIAFKMKFISLKKLKELTKPFGESSYGKYLKSLVNENQ